jgi:hypothetical protein
MTIIYEYKEKLFELLNNTCISLAHILFIKSQMLTTSFDDIHKIIEGKVRNNTY